MSFNKGISIFIFTVVCPLLSFGNVACIRSYEELKLDLIRSSESPLHSSVTELLPKWQVKKLNEQRKRLAVKINAINKRLFNKDHSKNSQFSSENGFLHSRSLTQNLFISSNPKYLNKNNEDRTLDSDLLSTYVDVYGGRFYVSGTYEKYDYKTQSYLSHKFSGFLFRPFPIHAYEQEKKQNFAVTQILQKDGSVFNLTSNLNIYQNLSSTVSVSWINSEGSRLLKLIEDYYELNTYLQNPKIYMDKEIDSNFLDHLLENIDHLEQNVDRQLRNTSK